MSILQIRKAQREGARVVIGLAGISGSGKTFSALQLAWGLAGGKSEKVGLIDSENKRGSLYSDILVGRDGAVHQFLIGDLYAPFTPERYKQAILEFQAAGVEVLVIDSASHEYEGEGGYLDIRQPLPGKFGNRDNVAAEEHKKFMRALLQSNMHIIVCVRAREKVKIEKDGQNKTIYVPLGLQPIQHKDFMFEMTASLMVHDQGKRQEVLKCPADLLPILGRQNDYITSRDGMAIRKWVDGAKQLDPAIERTKNELQTVTDQGAAAVNAAWGALTAKMRKALGDGFLQTLLASAQAFEDAKAEKTDSGDDAVAGLNAAASAQAQQTEAPADAPTTTQVAEAAPNTNNDEPDF